MGIAVVICPEAGTRTIKKNTSSMREPTSLLLSVREYSAYGRTLFTGLYSVVVGDDQMLGTRIGTYTRNISVKTSSVTLGK